MNTGQNKCHYCKCKTQCQLVVLFDIELFCCFPCSVLIHRDGNIMGIPSPKSRKDNNSMSAPRNSPPSDTDSDDSKVRKVFVDELLCFLQNKNDYTTTDLLVDICCDFYTHEQILESKLFIYEQVKPKQRILQRRGQDKEQANVRDIIQVFKEMEPTDDTTFVAANLAKVPPFYMESKDCRKLMSELGELKEEMAAMRLKQDEMAKYISSQSASQPVNSTNIEKSSGGKRGVKQAGKVNKPPAKGTAATTHTSTPPPSSPSPPPPPPPPSADKDTGVSEAASTTAAIDAATTSAAAATTAASASASEDAPAADRKTTTSSDSSSATNPVVKSVSSYDSSVSTTCDADASSDESDTTTSRQSYKSALMNGQPEKGWSVKRKRIRKKETSADTNCILKAIGPKPEQQRRCVGVFVSRLEAHHSAEDINNYLAEIGVKSKASKIALSSKIHSSFYIRCNKSIRERLLTPGTWPTGVYVKRYFE